MPGIRMVLLAACATAAFLAAPVTSRAADFYKGKTLTIIVGFSPGGGYDSYGRLLGQFIKKYIPGHPTVIVQNMPGAGSLTAARSLDTTKPKDGTVMLIFNPGLVTQSIVQPDRVKLDFRKFAWIGVATPDFRVCYGFGDKGPKTWDEMMHLKQFNLGGTGKGSGNYINGATLRVVFGAPIKQILGFPGSAEQRLAIERGELDGDCGSVSSIPIQWIRDGKAHIFLRFTKHRPESVPASAPYIDDFAKTDEQKKLLDFLDAANDVGRPFVMSNQVPADRIAIMRKAFNEAMKDPALIAQANKEQIPVSPISGKAAEKIVAKMVEASPAIVAKAKEIYE